MELSQHELSRRLTIWVQLAGCAAVAIIVGWWVTKVHVLIFIASALAVGFCAAALIDIHIAIFGLLFFSQIFKILGYVLPLPLGVNEFNMIFAALLTLLVVRYAITRRWELTLREKQIGNWLYIYLALILVSAVRAYRNFPNFDVLGSNLQIDTQVTIITSQFVKPAMYMGLFFIGYNFASDYKTRRWFILAMAGSLLVYTATMVLQYMGLFPLFAGPSEKAVGGILGASNALGNLLALCLPLFLVRQPYFEFPSYRVFSLIVAGVSLVAILYTRSRTGWVMALSACILVALTAKRLLSGMLALLGLAILLLTSPLWAPEDLKDYVLRSTIERGADPDAVLTGRVSIWSAAIRYVQSDLRLLLIGGGKFDFFSKGRELGLWAGQSTHHQLIQSLVDEGMLGLLLVFVLYWRISRVLISSWRHAKTSEVRDFARQMIIITVVMILSGTLIEERLASWYWFLLGMFMAARKSATEGGASQAKEYTSATDARPASAPVGSRV